MSRVHLQGRGEQERQTLLARDPAVEECERPRRVDAEATECLFRPPRSVYLRVDAVVDHVDTLWFHGGIAVEDVAAHSVGDGDHGVRTLHAGPFTEERKRVAAAELLRLPGPQRLEAVDGHDMRDRPHELGQVPTEVRVPRVAVHEVDPLDGRRHREIDRHRLEGERLRFGLGQVGPWLMARHAGLAAWLSPALHGDLGQPAQLAHEVLDVCARAAVDLGWIFASENSDLAPSGHCRVMIAHSAR